MKFSKLQSQRFCPNTPRRCRVHCQPFQCKRPLSSSGFPSSSIPLKSENLLVSLLFVIPFAAGLPEEGEATRPHAELKGEQILRLKFKRSAVFFFLLCFEKATRIVITSVIFQFFLVYIRKRYSTKIYTWITLKVFVR